MIRRRLPLMLTIMVTGILISLYLIISSPRVYESSALIQIDTSAAVDPSSDASLPAVRRVQLIEQRLMASSNILKVIDELELFRDAPELSEQEKITALRTNTRIESITNPGVPSESRMSLSAIVITSRAETPDTAAAIANYFTNSVVNRDRENRLSRITEGKEYLTNEERRLTDALSRQDREIAAFSSQNEDALPTAQESLSTELTQLNDAENTLDREIMALQRDQLTLIAGGTTAAERSASTLVQQIRNAEVELAQARRTLAPDHPEIKRLENNLRRLNAGDEAVSEIVRRQLELNEAQLANLNSQKATMDQRRTAIERARAKSPQVAERLEAMIREQSRLQDRYNEISRQLAQVETQQLLMDNDQTERFIVLERAMPPEFPAFSNRKKRAAMGAIGSIGFALALAFVLELKNPILRTSEQFARLTGTRPVISVPYKKSRRDILKYRLRVVYMGVLMFGGVFIALWLIGVIPGLPSPGTVPTTTQGLG
ncbi:GumC family protein [Paracoccus aestuariivivens]|uniref:Lipopolysaccharide biosynthesis protein n=1 Tax=Paracoccus aestuariivivens TaxID=1820333 RepID=A0A6L6J8J7_9RHOB|nr:lipopolysaccharide biosynthesis protein [Paracoccus aestuariivivens]MTH77826.1 lipopolysaccharide biosynthesis protein [Paracoccus aestuariivivens]